ncbi:AraC family transcriptional regulator [Flavobacterium sp. I-SCBP12n]|uniref:AraC family transcriptional regulator n=1 Tax=Flavobacterium pygoscelis TaxID=2893176 RepID=A0A9X1XNB5_9FLAO|nr:helix-turn-helix domain-containing protein [Flavobacterium pygoscelis]MCK8140760.1 AraC family transcriptional regulator [Flavobacterium pygoscelis]
MTAVKTYKSINSNQENLHFNIAKMQDIYTLRNGKVDEPHRHNFYSVLIISKAKGIHKIDFNAYELAEKQIFFIAPGQVHQVIEHEKSEGFSMTFSNHFLVENSIPISFIESLNLFQNYGQSPPLQLESKAFESVENFANQIVELFNSNAAMKFLSIGSFLKLILIACNNSCAINPIESDIDISGASLIRNFKNSVNQNFKKEHSTTFYANQLFITPDHLNRTFKAKVGKTAKEFIQARIITEAKRLLFFSSLTNKEIAYQLGFNEPANFSAFFKKHTKLSPSHFKKREIK